MNLQAKRRDDRGEEETGEEKKERLPEGRSIVEKTVVPQVRVFPVIAQRRGPAVEGVEPRRDATGAVQDVS